MTPIFVLLFLITTGIALDIPNDNFGIKKDCDAMIWGTTNIFNDYFKLEVSFENFFTYHTDKHIANCTRVKITLLAKKEQVVMRSKILVGEQSLYCKPGGDVTFAGGSKFKQSFGEWRANDEPIKEYIYLKENESICLLYDILIIDSDIDKQNLIRRIATVEYNPSKTNLSVKINPEILNLIPETMAQAYCDIPTNGIGLKETKHKGHREHKGHSSKARCQ